MLFLLLALQGCFSLLALAEQGVLVAANLCQLLVLFVYLCLLFLDELSLGTLVGGVFAYKTQTTVYLGEVLGTEYEHQLVLYALMACHIAHGLDEVALALTELCLKGGELTLDDVDVAVDDLDVFLDAIDGLALLVYLCVDLYEVVESLAYIVLLGFELFLLVADLFLYL